MSLAAAIREIGAEPVILGIARDSRESHREKMAEGLKGNVLIASAGVSAVSRRRSAGASPDMFKGEKAHVRQI